MNKQDFHKQLQAAPHLTALPAEELEQLVQRYPFFQSAHLLLTRAYLQKGDYRQTDQVQQAALYAGDRGALFQILKQEIQPTPAEAVVPTNEAEPIVAPIAETPAETPVVETMTEPVSATLDETTLHDLATAASQIIDDEPQTALSTAPALSSDELPIIVFEPRHSGMEEAPLVIETDAPKEHPSVIAPLDPQLSEAILLEAIQSSLEQEIMEDVREQRATNSSDAIEEPSDSTLSPFAQWMQNRSKQIAFDAGATPMPGGEQPEDVQNWLRKSTDIAETIEGRLENLSPSEAQPLIAHGAQRMDVPEKRDQQKALIERFIKMDPRITPGKAADYSISDQAKESLEDDLGYVTETMAQLFVFQGKIDRARKAYKKLMVLHPEKSVYFATQLKNIDRIKKL
jgi:tetratricopeptide (TPR) repeat protein